MSAKISPKTNSGSSPENKKTGPRHLSTEEVMERLSAPGYEDLLGYFLSRPTMGPWKGGRLQDVLIFNKKVSLHIYKKPATIRLRFSTIGGQRKPVALGSLLIFCTALERIKNGVVSSGGPLAPCAVPLSVSAGGNNEGAPPPLNQAAVASPGGDNANAAQAAGCLAIQQPKQVAAAHASSLVSAGTTASVQIPAESPIPEFIGPIAPNREEVVAVIAPKQSERVMMPAFQNPLGSAVQYKYPVPHRSGEVLHAPDRTEISSTGKMTPAIPSGPPCATATGLGSHGDRQGAGQRTGEPKGRHPYSLTHGHTLETYKQEIAEREQRALCLAKKWEGFGFKHVISVLAEDAPATWRIASAAFWAAVVIAVIVAIYW